MACSTPFCIHFGSNNSLEAIVDGALDPRLPVVILMHGLGGSSADMTAPLSSRGGVAFNRSAGYPLYSDAGVHFTPPVAPVNGFFIDPLLTTVTSWKSALKAAGFTTVTYSQNLQSIAADAADLASLAKALATCACLADCGFAFVAHSRGGPVVRSFLASAIGSSDMDLTGFMARTTTLITLHSPNAGSSLATDAAAVDAVAAQLQMAITAMGLPPFAPLAALRSAVGNTALVELAVGSAALAAISAAEPVAGIAYHTFGGNSTNWVRLWANVFTPDSMISPLAFLGFPLPFFHWGTTPVELGSLLNPASFFPVELLVGPIPVLTEAIATLVTLAALAPELADGLGDTLVTDISARLPFSLTHTTNQLNHLEALYDPTLQRQVIGILSGLGSPLFSGTALATLHPSARRGVLTNYSVTAVDSVTGISLTPSSVSVRDPHGGLLFTSPGASFSFKFAPAYIGSFDPDTHRREGEWVWPTVAAQFSAPYGTVGVFTGHP